MRIRYIILLALAMAAYAMLATGCTQQNFHPAKSVLNLFNGNSGHRKANPIIPECNDSDDDDCAPCPVCGKKDHKKHGHTNNGHHYGWRNHFAGG